MNKTVEIKLNSVKEVEAFSNTLRKFDSKFELVSGRYVADAKSVMGIYSLDLSHPLTLRITSPLENMAEVLDQIKPYMAV